MTTEEKAKAYDEAVCKMKEIITMDNTLTIPREIGEYLFPELKESDEKIKKKLIHLVKESHEQGGYALHKWEADEMLAWLEKQSTPQVRTGLEWLNTIDDACDKRYAEEYAHGEYCHEQSFKWGFQEGVDWLEKQGEPTDINPSEFDLRLNKLLKQFETLPKEELASSLSFYLNVVQNDGTYKPTDWSDEDKKIFNQIVSIIEDSDLVRAENISIYTNWLKSRVQPQLNWRPTELQIEALESATENCAYSEYQDCLKELIKQLNQQGMC